MQEQLKNSQCNSVSQSFSQSVSQSVCHSFFCAVTLFSETAQPIAVKFCMIFTYSSPYFCFLWRRPCDYHAVCCMGGKTIQCLPICQSPRSMYLSIFNSFRVIRCLSQCVSPKIAIFTTFLLGYPMVKKFRRYLYLFWPNSRT